MIQGLDALTAEMLMLALANVVMKTKCCIVVVIHQPSALIYSLFDDVVFLCRGKVIYSGRRELADESLDNMEAKLAAKEGKQIIEKKGDYVENSDVTLNKAMNLFKAKTRKWAMLRHVLYVPRASSDEDYIKDELKVLCGERSNIKRAIDGNDPAPGFSALLIEIFAFNNLSIASCVPLMVIPLGAVLTWGFLDATSPKHDTAKVMLEVYVVGFALLNILLPDVFSHLHTNIDCLQDRVFRGTDMFWCLQVIIPSKIRCTRSACLCCSLLPWDVFLP